MYQFRRPDGSLQLANTLDCSISLTEPFAWTSRSGVFSCEELNLDSAGAWQAELCSSMANQLVDTEIIVDGC